MPIAPALAQAATIVRRVRLTGSSAIKSSIAQRWPTLADFRRSGEGASRLSAARSGLVEQALHGVDARLCCVWALNRKSEVLAPGEKAGRGVNRLSHVDDRVETADRSEIFGVGAFERRPRDLEALRRRHRLIRCCRRMTFDHRRPERTAEIHVAGVSRRLIQTPDVLR